VKKQVATTLTNAWAKPATTAAFLSAIAETKNANYNYQVKSLLDDKRPAVRNAAMAAGKSLGLIKGVKPKGPIVGGMKLEAVVALMLKNKGDARQGEKLFTQLGCVACHTTKADQTPKGPFLGGIAKRYKRKELTLSIMQPSAVIAQGFESQWFDLEDGSMLEGFVVKEGAAEIEIRTIKGVPHIIKTKDIFERGKRKSSMMPQDLVKNISPTDLAAILAYLESLKGK
jgi:putative heme-binding domain-containing protein